MPEQIVLPLQDADPRTFTGTAYIRLMAAAERESRVKLYYVRFEPGARTHWHAHGGTQLLVVSAGRCRYQREGESVREADAGESVKFEPGIRHWHGAVEGESAEHIAVNLDTGETEWMEEVSHAEYRSAPAGRGG
jgi:quercetin dioxygenase-like cupin family protein